MNKGVLIEYTYRNYNYHPQPTIELFVKTNMSAQQLLDGINSQRGVLGTGVLIEALENASANDKTNSIKATGECLIVQFESVLKSFIQQYAQELETGKFENVARGPNRNP